MTSRLSKNVLSAAGQTVAQGAVLVLLYRYLLDTIGVEKLGIWAVVLATASAARVSELGFAGSATKFVATYRSKGDDQAATEALQTAAVSIAAVLGIVLVVIYPGLLWALPHVLPPAGMQEGRSVLPYALLSLWLTAVVGIWMGGLDACLRTDLRAGLMIFGSVAFLLMSLASVARYGLLGLAMAQVAQGVILVVLGWVVVRRVMRSGPLLPIQWKLARFREMLGYGINFQIISVVIMLFEPVTKILLGRYGELAAAGYFEMAQRLVMMVRAMLVESNRVIVPVFAGMGNRSGDARKLYISNVRYLFFLVTPIFAALLAFAPAISEIWIGVYQSQFVVMAVCLTVAWYLNSVTAPPYFAYLGHGKLRWVTIAHIIMGSVNILAGLILGHLFGWRGVIAAFAIALVFGSLIPVWAYHREHQFSVVQILSIPDTVLASICFGAAVIALAGYWVALNADVSMWARVTLITGGVSIVMVAAAWRHPLRQQVFSIAKARSWRARGEV